MWECQIYQFRPYIKKSMSYFKSFNVIWHISRYFLSFVILKLDSFHWIFIKLSIFANGLLCHPVKRLVKVASTLDGAKQGHFFFLSKPVPNRVKFIILHFLVFRIGILLSKLFWPTVRKKCSSDQEKNLKFEAGSQVFANILRSLEQFVQTVKGQNNSW